MAICVNCGKEFKVIGRRCPYCNMEIGVSSVTNKETIKRSKNDYDQVSNGLFLVSVFIPFSGLILYQLKKEEEPLKARSSLAGFLVGTIIYLALIALVLVIKILK